MRLTRQLAVLPVDRVLRLDGPPIGVIAAAATADLDEVAVVVLAPGPHSTPAAVVGAVLDELARVAAALLPGWLPEATDLPGDPYGLAAVRAAATSRARTSPRLGPLYRELATAALAGRAPRLTRFPPELRCRGLGRIVANGFDRPGLVLLLEVPPGLPEAGERALVAAAEWLAQHGRIGVWLAGAPLEWVDRLTRVRLATAEEGSGAGTAAPVAPVEHDEASAQPLAVPVAGVTGRPHPASAAETSLEAALAGEPWAAGRCWNQTYQSHRLTAPVRLDLLWPTERCVVEVDGPEHCHPVRFEADRQRDVRLQLDGHAVLRFTNTQISYDVGSVVHQIGTFIRARRRAIAEGRFHAR
ncbi:DUF559 domain-containing protein [Micromonospora sp. NPDC000089]|uniref:DUF559 domain-containing protein n=1 Tax=unclassified Micromonospora TaxID=2617518 RepID=UPI0036C3E1BC